VTVFAKQAQDPTRSRAENVRLGIGNSAAVSFGVAPLVYGVSKTAEVVGWENLTVSSLALAGIAATYHRVRKFRRAAQAEAAAASSEETEREAALPRYDLSVEELAAIDLELAEKVRQQVGNKVCAVWLRGDDPRANAVRTREAELFPELPELMGELEDSSSFLAIVDARRSAGDGRIVRGTRVTGSMYRNDPENGDVVEDNGLIKGLVDSGQITAEEVREHYDGTGLDLTKSASIESNFRVGDRVPRVRGVPLAHLAYLAMVQHSIKRMGSDGGDGSLVAHVNDATISSFNRLGIRHLPFAGREDLLTPSAAGEFDDKYKPVVYTYDEKTRKVFKRLSRLALPELEL
jgi:hypothetical protein